MAMDEQADESVHVTARNIGGIGETAVEFRPGVTALTGRNATNRTSFLRAIMAALGSDDVALKGDASEGAVEFSVGGETYTRTLSRRNGTVVFDGDPYLADSELADLFAFLLESNDARRAVERGEDLYDVIMRPVDTADVDAEIERRKAEREAVRAELAELDSLEGQLPELEEQRTRQAAELEATREELAAQRAELEAIEGEQAPVTDLEGPFEELRETRRELERVREERADEAAVVEALREDRAEVEAALDGLAEAAGADELEAEIARHREELQAIESSLGELQSVIQFNESLLEEPHADVLGAVRETADDHDAPVTDKLLDDGEDVVCWTCGSQVDRGQVEETLDLLREVHSEKIDRRNSLRETVDDLESQRKHIERTREKRRSLRQRLAEVESALEDRTDRVDQLTAEAEQLEDAVADLEAAVEDLEADGHDELLAMHRAVNELEFELDRLESDLEATEDEIETIESRLEQRDELEAEVTAIDRDIEELRSRIERLEADAVERFNDQMETILDLLEYENLERIWIERVDADGRGQRGQDRRTVFDLHVVRATGSGTVYEDTVDHLSESEREVVGLVVALSGYLVHEVYEAVPFMLLDSLEAFDSDRVARLVDHFAQYADYLVVALLPDDAAALDEDHERITEL